MKDFNKKKEYLIKELSYLRQKADDMETSCSNQIGADDEAVNADSRLEYMLALGPAVIYIAEPSDDYRAVFVSRNVKDQMGYEPDEFTANPSFWAEHIHPDDAGRVFEELRNLHVKGHCSCEYRFLHKDGDYHLIYNELKLFHDADGDPAEAIGYWMDITGRRHSAEEKERLQAQLIQAQKMGAVGTLAGGIAHDFNNIITVVKSLTDLMIGKVGRDSPLYSCLIPISESSKKAMNLVQQLLLFSRNKPAGMAAVSLNDAVSELTGMLEHLISEDVTIETDLMYDLWEVKADKGRLEQIIINLVLNSSEAMLHGGTVVIRTGNIKFNEGQYSAAHGSAHGRFVCLTVEDTGAGMDKDVLDQIFEPFFTTKARGTGMGLAVVYRIVNEHKGWINVSSEPGAGTVFKIYLPAAEAEEAEVKGPLIKKRNTGRGRRILLVEDEKWVRKSTTMVLCENGYEVFEASNAEEAISVFYREKGRFDLVLSDVVMPGRNGLQLVGPLLDINPDIPILLCSGYLDDKAQLDQIIKRGLPYIQKPYEIPELLEAIEDTINQNQGLH